MKKILFLLPVVLLAGCGSSRPSTQSLLSTACSEVSTYDQNAVVRMSDGLPAGYAGCASPGEHPPIAELKILHPDPGSGYTVGYY